jgi:DNA helicase HerA-like ATPase
LVPSGQEDERRADYPGCTVETLAIGTAELSGEDWKLLMGIAGGEQMYARQMQRVLGDLRSEISLSTIRAGIEEAGLTANQKRMAETRLGFCQKYVRDDARVSDVLKPGRLVIVDIRDPYIDQPDALSVFMVLLNRFSGAGRGETKFNKMIVFDEAHKYMKDTRLADEIGEAVREMRKKGVTIVIASQDPVSVPRIVLELSTVVIAHRMESDKWGRALREAKIQFSGVDTSRLAQLNVGEAFLWSGGGAARYRTPERVSMRPRLTRHGGGTIRADD